MSQIDNIMALKNKLKPEEEAEQAPAASVKLDEKYLDPSESHIIPREVIKPRSAEPKKVTKYRIQAPAQVNCTIRIGKRAILMRDGIFDTDDYVTMLNIQKLYPNFRITES